MGVLRFWRVSDTLQTSFGLNQTIPSFIDHSSDISPPRTRNHLQNSALPKQDCTDRQMHNYQGVGKTPPENKPVLGMDGLQEILVQSPHSINT